MSALIHPKTITVDGLSVRYAEGGQDGPDAILMSPWPESVFAFEPTWPHLAAAAHLVHRFQNSNHIKRHCRVYRTKYGRQDVG